MGRIAQRKNTAVQIGITFAPPRAFITSQVSSSEDEPAYLIAAYLLFAAQYFYICDKRQTFPVANCLAENLRAIDGPEQLGRLLLAAVRPTFSPTEEKAFVRLHRYGNQVPLTYSDIAPYGRTLVKYSMITYKRGFQWEIDLRLSLMSFEVVFLPATVAVLFDYVSDKIGEENKELFASCVFQFLCALTSSDFRSTREGAVSSLTNIVIAKNLDL